MSVWTELAFCMREPSKFKYEKKDTEELAEVLKKSWEGDEQKAKDLLLVLKMINEGKSAVEVHYALTDSHKKN